MKRLTIYFTSDVHGYLFPTDFTSSTLKPMGLLSMSFPKDGNTLVLDGGDTIQGSPLTYYCREENLPPPAAGPMNDRGYDYVTLGNHDFNYGPSWLSAHLRALNAPCLCANVQDALGRLPLLRWTVHTMENGLRVGLFGIVTHWVNRWERPENLRGITVSDPLPAAREAVAALKKQGADQIVCLYHGGLERDPDTGKVLSETDENIACRLCEEVPVDLLLTGHQHIGMAEKHWAGVPLAQTPCNGAACIRAELDENGWHTALCPVTAPDLAWQPRERALWVGLGRFLVRPVGRLPFALRPQDRLTMALHGTGIAELINQVQLWASGAELSCTALANEVRGFDACVTVQDVVASYPYANTLKVLRVDGRTLRLALEQCARYFAFAADGSLRVSDEYLKPKKAHYNYDFFAGISYVFDLSRPEGSRVTEITREGRPVRDSDTFTLCMNSYRATGAGHYDFYQSLPVVREIQTEISELILDYFREHPEVSLPDKPAFCVTGYQG